MSRALAAAASVVLAGLALAAVGCDDRPLLARGRVVSPRVLAIVAEPPEVRPGQVVAIRAVTGGLTMTPRMRWFVCARPEATTTFTASSTFGLAEPDEGCFGDAATGVLAIADEPGRNEVVVPVPADLLDRLEALRAVYGQSLPPDALRRIARTAGLPFTVALEMTHGSTVVRAIKRVVVIDRAEQNANPPPPSFRFGVTGEAGTGGTPMRGTPSDDACVHDGEAPLVVRRGARVEMAPDPTEAPWLQDYDQLDSSGMVSRASETAFYSWYATGGWFTAERTRIPTRNTIWTAPDAAGTVTHWLIVRDGRGGTSACRYTVRVE